MALCGTQWHYVALCAVVKSACHRAGGEDCVMNENETAEALGAVIDRDAVISAAAEYIEACRSETVGAKSKGRFPNLAGFCRYLGIGLEALEEIFGDYRESYGALCAVFEDEALNSDLSATVITAYLKQRLGYGEKTEPKRAACEFPEVKLVFDHDIFEDGG